ncbi:hypothetical protein TREVI0001_0323 [Treponema vincentii ATCC 35580]|uniref:Uncharacterized protein n=1 Tax=Treponema vincentii ATCC 35580 TaxID=596324 RepID=C8PQ19_9SPIR|nr:hypothetical protein TREVI0001_0323 [Treponema vincentii ATCC 35580]
MCLKCRLKLEEIYNQHLSILLSEYTQQTLYQSRSEVFQKNVFFYIIEALYLGIP